MAETEKPKGSVPEKGKDASAMLDLFQAQVVEENSLGKFAAALKDIEAADLLRDAIQVRDWLRGQRH